MRNGDNFRLEMRIYLYLKHYMYKDTEYTGMCLFNKTAHWSQRVKKLEYISDKRGELMYV